MTNKDFCLSSYIAFRYIWKDGVDFAEGFQHNNIHPVDTSYRIPVKTSEDIDREIKKQFELLQNEVIKQKLPIKLYLGQEICYTHREDIISMLKNGELLTLNNTNRVLLEFSFTREPEDIAAIIYNFNSPIINTIFSNSFFKITIIIFRIGIKSSLNMFFPSFFNGFCCIAYIAFKINNIGNFVYNKIHFFNQRDKLCPVFLQYDLDSRSLFLYIHKFYVLH